MGLIIISTIIVIVGFGLLVRLFWSKLPDLKNLDTSTLAIVRERHAKTKLLQAKLTRSSEAFKNRWQQTIGDRGLGVKRNLSQLQARLHELEQHYRRHDVMPEEQPLTIDGLFSAARHALEQEEFPEAEKHLIEVLSRDNQNIRAYEMLGDLYTQSKNYHQAEEIFQYLVKYNLLQGVGHDKPMRRGKWEELETELLGSIDVSPQVAIYYDDLGSIYELMQRPERALDSYLKAISIEPNNPRYLDKLIGIAIVVGDEGLAKKTFRRLKKINPENAKLSELEGRIEKMKQV